MITDTGKDEPGDIITSFLNENAVNTDSMVQFDDGSTAISLAFLDQERKARYRFFKLFPSNRVPGRFPEPVSGDIILFGSYHSLNPAIRDPVLGFLQKGKQNGAWILYDPNFRKSHSHEREQLLPKITENMELAHVVRGSDEDFLLIFASTDADTTYRQMTRNSKAILFYTRGKDGVEVRYGGNSSLYPVIPVDPVSTIGAGDGFNAGIIYGMTILGMNQRTAGWISPQEIEVMASFGIRFASEVCRNLENYISPSFVNSLVHD